jgi:hypothetical protein
VIAELLGERSGVQELHGTLPRQKSPWNTTSRSPGWAARIAPHRSRRLLHLFLRTLEAPPFFGADLIVNSDNRVSLKNPMGKSLLSCPVFHREV